MSSSKTGAPVPRHGLTPLSVPPRVRSGDGRDVADPPMSSGAGPQPPLQAALCQAAALAAPAGLPAAPLSVRQASAMASGQASPPAKPTGMAAAAALDPALLAQDEGAAVAAQDALARAALQGCASPQARSVAVLGLVAPLLQATLPERQDHACLQARVRLLACGLTRSFGSDQAASVDDTLEALHSLPARPGLREAALDGFQGAIRLGTVPVGQMLARHFMRRAFWEGDGDYSALYALETLLIAHLRQAAAKDEKGSASVAPLAPAEGFIDTLHACTASWPAAELMEVVGLVGRVIVASGTGETTALLARLVLQRSQPRDTVARMKALALSLRLGANGRQALLALRAHWLSAQAWKGVPSSAKWLALLAVGWEAAALAAGDSKKGPEGGWDALGSGAQGDEACLWEAGRAIARDPVQAMAPGAAMAEAAARAPGRPPGWLAESLLVDTDRHVLYGTARLARLPAGEPLPDDFAQALAAELRKAGRADDDAVRVLALLGMPADEPDAPLSTGPSPAASPALASSAPIGASAPSASAATADASAALPQPQPAPAQSDSASITS